MYDYKSKAEVQFMSDFAANKHPVMHSQKGQDHWVRSILGDKREGYFLDLAAADGLLHSNTVFFERELDWTGLLIEPNPEFFAAPKQNRSSTCINEVVSNERHAVEFRYDNGQLGGIVADDTDNSERIRGSELGSGVIEQRQAVTLKDILEANHAPAFIDYFSLDVEGAEERIISSLDFDWYAFGLITIERANEAVNEILFENGYKFVRNIRFDTFYAHPDYVDRYNIELHPFVQVPSKDW